MSAVFKKMFGFTMFILFLPCLALGGSLSGTVIDEVTGLPIQGIGVNVAKDGQLPSFGTGTASDGSYTISTLESGIYEGG